MKNKMLAGFGLALFLGLVGSFIDQSPKINGRVRNAHGITQVIEKTVGVAVLKADSTVAILDLSYNPIDTGLLPTGSVQYNSPDACTYLGLGQTYFAAYDAGRHVFLSWDCEDPNTFDATGYLELED